MATCRTLPFVENAKKNFSKLWISLNFSKLFLPFRVYDNCDVAMANGNGLTLFMTSAKVMDDSLTSRKEQELVRLSSFIVLTM